MAVPGRWHHGGIMAGQGAFLFWIQPVKESATKVLSVFLSLVLAACASSPPSQRDAEKLELFRAHAGEPVSSFWYSGRINGWTPLGDSALVVWTRPSQAFLLELFGPCQDLQWSPFISFTSTGNRVNARFDSVIVRTRSPVPGPPCRIREIRPLDVKAIRAAEKQPPPEQRETDDSPPPEPPAAQDSGGT